MRHDHAFARAVDVEFRTSARLDRAQPGAWMGRKSPDPANTSLCKGGFWGESCADAHLHEADVLGILAEALPADVEVVLANDTPLVRAHAAVDGG